jgi:hypothetical protein
MKMKDKKFLPHSLLIVLIYSCFLGTAIAGLIKGKQINFSLVAALVALLLIFFNSPNLYFHKLCIKTLVLFFIALLPGLFFYIIREGSDGDIFIQLIGISLLWVSVWLMFSKFKYNPFTLFSIYLGSAKISALLGIFQEFSYLVDIGVTYDYSWFLIGAAELDTSGVFLRITSFFTEPSYFGVFLIPAIYFSVVRLRGHSSSLSYKESFIIITASLLTFSTITYIGIILCLIMQLKLKIHSVMILSGISLVMLVFIMVSPNIKARALTMSDIFSGALNINHNISSNNNTINLLITKNILTKFPLTGVGFGNYRIYSNEFLDDIIDLNPIALEIVTKYRSSLTLVDGGSMYFRIPAEFGLIGILIFLLIFTFKRRALIPAKELQIAHASLLFIASYSIRSGQISRFDFMFFCSLFILIYFKNTTEDSFKTAT